MTSLEEIIELLYISYIEQSASYNFMIVHADSQYIKRTPIIENPV